MKSSRIARRGGLARAEALSPSERAVIARKAARARWLRGKKKLAFDREALATVCSRWGLTEVAVFGSGARGDMRPTSDVDLMVTGTFRHNISSWEALRTELEAVFGRPVDLVTRRNVERDWRSETLRRRVLAEAKVIHATA